MAFDITRFSRVSLADNTGRLVLQDASVVNAPAYYTYASASDTTATIAGANYFNAEAVIYDLKVNDVIMAVGSNANIFLMIATVDTTTTPKTITTTEFTAAGVVDTANIADGAVTNAKVNAAAAIDYSKLATLSSGNILVGSAGGVATSVAMSGDVAIIASGATTIQAGAVDSSMMNANMLRYAAVAITASEFNGMYAAPKQLVAAAGANTLIVLEQLQLAMTYDSAAYAAGGVAAVQYDSTINGAGVIASTTLPAARFQATASSTFTMNAGVVVLPFATTVNKGLYLSNVSGAFTTGDSDMVAHIWYRVVPTV